MAAQKAEQDRVAAEAEFCQKLKYCKDLEAAARKNAEEEKKRKAEEEKKRKDEEERKSAGTNKRCR